jgi:uncharacterized protein YceK
MVRLTLIFSVALLMASCTTVEQVIENKEVYCSGMYKGVRAVGRSALSLTTGVILPDVCDSIDEIVEEENAEDGVTKSAE